MRVIISMFPLAWHSCFCLFLEFCICYEFASVFVYATLLSNNCITNSVDPITVSLWRWCLYALEYAAILQSTNPDHILKHYEIIFVIISLKSSNTISFSSSCFLRYSTSIIPISFSHQPLSLHCFTLYINRCHTYL